MFRIALKGILGRKARLVLTSLAVILGTAFLTGTSVFSATINRTFDNLFQDVFRNIDAYVRSEQVIEGDFGAEERQRIPVGIVDIVRGVPGVAEAVGDIQAYARVVGKDGKPLGADGNGPPTFGSVGQPFKGQLWTITKGEFPKGGDQVALDEATADKAGYVLGDTVKVVAQAGSRSFTLVGIASYGDVRSPGGATFALFDLPTAMDFLTKPGFVDDILVAGDGSKSDQELSRDIAAAIPASYRTEVLTGAEITKETQDQIASGLSFFSIFLTIFSLIALGVGAFVIYNVFSISAAQRERENALLRAIGASRRQVSRALLIESVAVGLVGSTAGVVGGIGLAAALSAMLRAFGIDIPSEGLAVPSSAVVNTMVAGMVVTIASAWLPARRAGRVPPLAAMRSSAIETSEKFTRRSIIGTALALLGAAAIAAVMAGAPAALLGLGVLLVFAGVIVLGPVIAVPVSRAIGTPIARLRGVTGRMSRENSVRNPKRTSRTAAPVLIGVALVTAVSALAASIRGQIDTVITDQFRGDYVVSSNAVGFGGLSPQLALDIKALPQVEHVTGIGLTAVRIADKGQYLTTLDPVEAPSVFDPGFVTGSYADLRADTVAISEKYSDQKSLKIGDTLSAVFADGTSRTLRVAAVYAEDSLAGRFMISQAVVAGSTAQRFDFGVYIGIRDGVSQSDARAALKKAVDAYGSGTLESKREYIDTRAGQVNQLLGLIYGLLFLSVIIATVGIIITLLLSVFERQRETGLLRAVGMTRGQVRTVVRWESVITSLLGAVSGIVLGTGLGWVIVAALRDQGLTSFSLPVGTAVSIMVMAFMVGVIAAVYPAWRATKVDVLAALNTN